MNIVIIIEFMATSILFIVNIRGILNLFPKSNHQSSYTNKWLFFTIYICSSLAWIISELFFPTNIIRIAFFALYYIMLFLCVICCNSHYSCKLVSYITCIYLTADAILQSVIYLLFEFILDKYNVKIVMRTISTINNILAFILLKTKFNLKVKKIFVFDIHEIPNSIYTLILASLLFSSGLLSNQLIKTDAHDLLLQVKLNKILTAICIPMLILIIISLLFNCITKSYYKNASSLLEKQINMQLDYYKKLEKKNNELREFRHDYKNHMLCLQALINSNELEEASQYIQKLTNRSYYETSEYFTGNKIADAILTDKSAAAKNNGAEINFQGEIFDGISASDICVILSNALDNAIEACGQISGSGKSINVSCIFSRNVQIISISNPVISHTKIRNGFIETTKQDKSSHGFGLYNIKKTVDKYNGDFNIKCENGIFTLEIGFNIADSNIQNATVVYK